MGINFDLVDTLGTSKGTKRGEFFRAGFNYKVAIEKCAWLTARDKREYVVVETVVLESNCPEQPAGRKITYMINMSNTEMGQGNLADFLRIAVTKLALVSEGEVLDPNDDAYWAQTLADRALLTAILEESNILAGVELYLYTKPITTKKGNPFTVHEWSLEPSLKGNQEAAQA